MDIDQARTFLEIVRCGSLVAAAERLFVSQTAITARVQRLEQQLGCQLFVRSRNGASLTSDGEAFVSYANQMVQTWEAARRDLPLPEGCQQVLHVGGEVSLGNPMLLDWVSALHRELPSHAIRSEVSDGESLLRKVEMGLLDAALVYQPTYGPGLQVEQLMEEKLIRVRRVAQPDPYIYIDWGEAFRRQHDAALPDCARPALSFNLGPLALQFILDQGGSGYFRTRVVQAYLDSGCSSGTAGAGIHLPDLPGVPAQARQRSPATGLRHPAPAGSRRRQRLVTTLGPGYLKPRPC